MKVLIVTPGMHKPWIDGRITSLKTYAEALVNCGVHVDILTTQTGAKEIHISNENNVIYTSMPGGTIYNWIKLLRHYFEFIRKSDIDIVIYRPFAGFNMVNNSSIFLLRALAFLQRLPFVLAPWSGPMQYFKIPWFFSGIIATRRINDARSIYQIPPMINHDTFHRANVASDIFKKYGIDKRITHVFLYTYCARIDTDRLWSYTMLERGLRDVILAAKHLSDLKFFTFLISIPILSNKSTKEKLNRILVEHGVSQHFTLTSEIEDLPILLSYISAYLYPINLDEPSWAPISILEAFACGAPVITTRTKVISEFVAEDEALLVDPGNEKELAEAVRSLSTNDALAKKYSSKGKEAIENRYSSNAVAQKLLSSVEDIINR